MGEKRRGRERESEGGREEGREGGREGGRKGGRAATRGGINEVGREGGRVRKGQHFLSKSDMHTQYHIHCTCKCQYCHMKSVLLC